MTDSPYRAFKERLCTFANGQAGIRNPFVIAAVDPSIEHRTAERLSIWATGTDEAPSLDDTTVQSIWLDELLPETRVYNLSMTLGGETSPKHIERTMQDRLAEELVQEMVEHADDEKLETQRHVLLLLNLGSLYPFTRASELLDELDRRNVRSTIGIPFPGDIGGDSQHYYPAHQIDGQIREMHLQQ